MRAAFDFIVEAKDGKRMNNTRNWGGIDVIVNTTQEEAFYSGREATVIAIPNWYKGDIEIGDTLLVHHNVFRRYNDWHGANRDGRAFIKDGLFHVSEDKFFAYKKEGGEWVAWDKYCLILPVKPDEDDNSFTGSAVYEVPLHGIVHTPNEEMMAQGINKGDKIVFRPDSEYAFDIDGVKVYRMLTEHIAAVYG